MHATQLALLRGINVGGKNKLPMRDLSGMFVEAGCENVRTFIQSGNVIFTAGSPNRVETLILERFGYRVPVILRTAEQIREVVSKNPFPQMEEALHVMFLANRPGSKEVAALDANRSTPDAFTLLGQEIYLHLPNGAGNTKLTNAWFDSRLATTSTMRNWRTVTKLLALMEE